jgi:hypothetical protein
MCVKCREREGTLVHGNGKGALGALGIAVRSERRGQSGVHGRARGLLPRGIDPMGRSKPDGEVMAQGVDGGTLPRFDVLDGHGDVQGRRGVA